ncbi:LOW QUALITY PROTEIN: Hypothetical protein PHPALM_301 [Phytophthora palmivora]|uniref:Uncharacterized protein n=1 Tax=Phytophthora palmivora TaxID=4796 RepID=A0A2P4YV70_9STRA|nr:LOW QUALITY PROTEIN: Hypothetical protein PHPALM_301 [Phytophthora palmivora]
MESDEHLCASLTATEVVNAVKNTARKMGDQQQGTRHTQFALVARQRWSPPEPTRYPSKSSAAGSSIVTKNTLDATQSKGLLRQMVRRVNTSRVTSK